MNTDTRLVQSRREFTVRGFTLVGQYGFVRGSDGGDEQMVPGLTPGVMFLRNATIKMYDAPDVGRSSGTDPGSP